MGLSWKTPGYTNSSLEVEPNEEAPFRSCRNRETVDSSACALFFPHVIARISRPQRFRCPVVPPRRKFKKVFLAGVQPIRVNGHERPKSLWNATSVAACASARSKVIGLVPRISRSFGHGSSDTLISVPGFGSLY